MKTERRIITNRRASIFIRAVLLCVAPWFVFVSRPAAQGLPLTAAPANEATASIQGDRLCLSNNTIETQWRFQENGLVSDTLTDRFTNRTIPLASNAFIVSFEDGTVLKSSEMHLISRPNMEKLKPDPNASQFAARLGGWQIEVALSDRSNRLHVMSARK
jgi:hypothetical protein